jgi:HK97 family phage major capsid protein/HK97 family phage prohead protease
MANVNGTEINLTPTSGMKTEAKRYKEWKKDGKAGGTDDAARRATQILSGSEMSADVVITMNAWFARHESDKSGKGFRPSEKGYPSKGRVAWAAWGGDAGQTWARSKSNSIKKARERTMSTENERAEPDALSVGDFVSWSSSGGRAAGRITKITKDGSINVPNSSFTINGTEDDPAALIKIYRDNEETDDTYAGHKFSTLTKISPIRSSENMEQETPIESRDLSEKFQRTELTEFRSVGKGRTFEFPFSSEYPVERYFGKEVLKHDDKSIDFSRLNSGAAPLLWNHDPDRHIGIVERAYIDKDKKRAYAKVRFSRNKFASEVLEDVKDGILRGISFGYQIKNMEEEDGAFVADDWMVHEISVTPIPADPTVGIGRSLISPDEEVTETSQPNTISIDNNSPEEEIRSAAQTASPSVPSMEEKSQETVVDTAPAVEAPEVAVETAERSVEVDTAAEVKRAVEEEQVRTSTIYAVCRQHGADDLTEKFIKDNKSVSEVNGEILDLISKRSESSNTPIRSTDMNPSSNEVGLEAKEVQRFSFLRAITALANPTDRNAQEAAAFEREVSEEAAKRYDKPASGILVPNEVLQGYTRDLNVGTATAGGNLVETELLAGSFIDILRNRMAVMQAGVTTLNGLSGNVSIPRQTSASTAYWVGEGSDVTESQQAFDQVNLTPKTIGATTDYTRKLLLQTSISVETMVRNDIAKQIALALDTAAIYGSGSSNQPTGITNTTGIGTATVTGVGTFPELIAMETDVAVANADQGALKYIVNATARGGLKSVKKDAGSGEFVFANNEINGYPVIVSNQLTNNDCLFGDFSQLIAAFWSGLDLTVDPYAMSKSGSIRIVALQDVDFGVKQPTAFCLGT